jgi:hypothetical protein
MSAEKVRLDRLGRDGRNQFPLDENRLHILGLHFSILIADSVIYSTTLMVNDRIRALADFTSRDADAG